MSKTAKTPSINVQHKKRGAQIDVLITIDRVHLITLLAMVAAGGSQHPLQVLGTNSTHEDALIYADTSIEVIRALQPLTTYITA